MTEEQASIQISDHAVLRYLERVKGVDIEAVKAEMMPSDKAVAAAREMGEARIKKRNFLLVVVNDVVVTVLRRLRR